MTEMFIGVKMVTAWPETKYEGDKEMPGYGVRYEDGYTSWSPKDVFERAYLPLGHYSGGCGSKSRMNDDRITTDMISAMIRKIDVQKVGDKTTMMTATLATGFEMVEQSSCVNPDNYDEDIGYDSCIDRIHERIANGLAFALQWAREGLRPKEAIPQTDRDNEYGNTEGSGI